MGHDPCRLCGESVRVAFRGTVLRKHAVQYFVCLGCESLQTEYPFWLDEAYSLSNLSASDTGAAQRNLQNLAICYFVVKLFGASSVLDVGGGDGLLCRLLRDYEVDCYVTDSHTGPVYAQGFTNPTLDKVDMVTAFEVVEHLAHPARELDSIFNRGAGVILLSTWPYRSQGEDWWYLASEAGQHVFFYSEKSMKILAERYGYHLVTTKGYFLFTEAASWWRMRFFKLFMRPIFVRLFRAIMMLFPARGVLKDHAVQQSR